MTRTALIFYQNWQFKEDSLDEIELVELMYWLFGKPVKLLHKPACIVKLFFTVVILILAARAEYKGLERSSYVAADQSIPYSFCIEVNSDIFIFLVAKNCDGVIWKFKNMIWKY